MTKVGMLIGGFAALALAISASCSKDEPAEDDDDATGGGGTVVGDSGTGGGSTADSANRQVCDLNAIKSQVVGSCEAGNLGMATARTANMLIVLDKSGSMASINGSLDKWNPMKAALKGAIEKVPEVNFGLDLFPAQTVTTSCQNKPNDNQCCVIPDIADSVTVDIGSGSSTGPLIATKLDETTPGGGTPTFEALDRALYYFTMGGGRGLTGEKYVLLATDGGPNCRDDLTADCEATGCTYNMDGNCTVANCCVGSSGRAGCLDDQRVVDKITELKNAEVSTFVVGLPGTDTYGEVLNRFADAGGHALTGDTRYYKVSDVSTLQTTFESITINLLTNCKLMANSPVIDPQNVVVMIDCTRVIPKGDVQAVVDSPEINITGDSCTTIEKGVNQLDYVFGCQSVL